jgi:hypothetical protein
MRTSGQVIHLPIQWENDRTRQKAERFLEANPFLFPLLDETIEKTEFYFGHPLLNLEVVDDPEDNFQQLVLNIITELPEDNAIQRFEQFRDEWWLDNLQRSQLKLVIALSYP